MADWRFILGVEHPHGVFAYHVWCQVRMSWVCSAVEVGADTRRKNQESGTRPTRPEPLTAMEGVPAVSACSRARLALVLWVFVLFVLTLHDDLVLSLAVSTREGGVRCLDADSWFEEIHVHGAHLADSVSRHYKWTFHHRFHRGKRRSSCALKWWANMVQTKNSIVEELNLFRLAGGSVVLWPYQGCPLHVALLLLLSRRLRLFGRVCDRVTSRLGYARGEHTGARWACEQWKRWLQPSGRRMVI